MSGVIISFLLAIMASVMSYVWYIPFANVSWDEAGSLFWGYNIYSAIKDFNWHELVSVSQQQIYPPPLQSWFIGTATQFVQFTIHSVRTVNLFWLIVSSVALYFLGDSVGGKIHKKTVSTFAVLLFLLSPMTLLLSAIVIKEMMGVALTIIFLLLYFRASDSQRPQDYAMAVCSWFLLYFTKYQYGLIPLVGIGISYIVDMQAKRTHKNRSALLFWGVIIGVTFSWAVIRRNELFDFYLLHFASETVKPGIWLDKILFYPRSIIYFYGISPLIGCMLIVSIFSSIPWLRERKFRTIWIITTLYIFCMAVNTNILHDRYLFTVSPFLYIIFARLFVRYVTRYGTSSNRNIRYLFLCTLIVFGVIHFGYIRRLPRYVYAMGSYSLRSPFFNQSDYRDLHFDYDTSHWPWQLPEESTESPSDVVKYIVDQVEPHREVILKGRANELSPVYLRLMLQIAANTRSIPSELKFSHFVVTIVVLPGSRLYNRDYVLYNKQISEEQIQEFDPASGYDLISQKMFSDLGVQVEIYGARQ